MKRVFLDTNVVFDFFLERIPFSDDAAFIFKLTTEKKLVLYPSTLTLANLTYQVQRMKKNPIQIISALLSWVEVVDLKKIFFEKTISSGFNDFEDGLQYFSALEVDNLDAIITRNKKDFMKSKIPVFTPSEFIKLHYS